MRANIVFPDQKTPSFLSEKPPRQPRITKFEATKELQIYLRYQIRKEVFDGLPYWSRYFPLHYWSAPFPILEQQTLPWIRLSRGQPISIKCLHAKIGRTKQNPKLEMLNKCVGTFMLLATLWNGLDLQNAFHTTTTNFKFDMVKTFPFHWLCFLK